MARRFMWFAFLGLLALEVGAAAIQTRTAMFTAPPAISQKVIINSHPVSIHA